MAKALFTDKEAQTQSQYRADRACKLTRVLDTARRHTFHILKVPFEVILCSKYSGTDF